MSEGTGSNAYTNSPPPEDVPADPPEDDEPGDDAAEWQAKPARKGAS
jgi:hypothetical protein